MTPDALTESFCERCGTSYEFEPPPKMSSMRRTRGVFSGLKNYIMSQDSLGDSVNDALRHQEESLASKQLDAFHSSFNFCIDCRQYTCTNCWNEDAGRCQSCQPMPELAGLQERYAATLGATQPEHSMLFPARDESAWPALDLTEPAPEPAPVGSGLFGAPVPWVEQEPLVAEVEPMVAEVEPRPEAVWLEPEPVAEPELEPVLAEVEAEPEPEPEPEPVRPPEPEQIPYTRLRPISDTFMHLPRTLPADNGQAAAAEVDEESLAARRTQLDVLGLGDPGEGTVDRTRPVVLPYRSSGAAAHPADRQAASGSVVTVGAFWDASAREVAGAISQIGVRSCGHCELSLSATARFCRRCGTPQAQSA